MHKRFFVRSGKTDRNGHPLWIELSGKQFYEFIHSQESLGRFFMDLEDYVLECSEQQYREYISELEHAKYLRKQQAGWHTVSYQDQDLFDGCNGEEQLTGDDESVEDVVLKRYMCDRLQKASFHLSEQEMKLLYDFFFAREKRTIRQLSEDKGVPVMTLQCRKNRLLRKLKKLLDSEK